MDLLKDVGAIAGLASFLGLALLSLLYFMQARDVRRLRENASFLVEGDEGEPVAPAERAATAVASTTKEPEEAAAAAAASAPNEAEAFRRAELARQAAERRKRFERRRRPNGGRERPAWLSEPLSIAVVAVGSLLVIAGIVFGVTKITGDDSSDTGATAKKDGKGPCPPGQTKVAVLNGTDTPGLAAQSAGQLRQSQYKVGPVGNTSLPFDTSVVMFDQATGASCAPIIAQIVGIEKTQPMDNDVRQTSEGDPVAVVLGFDKAETSSGTGASTTTGSEF